MEQNFQLQKINGEYHQISEEFQWYWQSNQDPFDRKQYQTWTPYNSAQNQYIERAYNDQRHEFIDIGDYVIHYGTLLQINKSDQSRQRPVKRDPQCKRKQITDFMKGSVYRPFSTGISILPAPPDFGVSQVLLIKVRNFNYDQEGMLDYLKEQKTHKLIGCKDLPIMLIKRFQIDEKYDFNNWDSLEELKKLGQAMIKFVDDIAWMSGKVKEELILNMQESLNETVPSPKFFHPFFKSLTQIEVQLNLNSVCKYSEELFLQYPHNKEKEQQTIRQSIGIQRLMLAAYQFIQSYEQLNPEIIDIPNPVFYKKMRAQEQMYLIFDELDYFSLYSQQQGHLDVKDSLINFIKYDIAYEFTITFEIIYDPNDDDARSQFFDLSRTKYPDIHGKVHIFLGAIFKKLETIKISETEKKIKCQIIGQKQYEEELENKQI